MFKLIDREDRRAYLVHLVTSLLFFSDFFLFHRVLVGSSDAMSINIPLILAAKRNFLSGHFGLWMPEYMGGTSSFLVAVSPLFSPDNWVHFLLPERVFFPALTFFAFVKFFLVGCFAYRVFSEELGDRRWGLFCSCCYQLCGFTLWGTMIYDSLGMLFFFTASLYVIWTLGKRPAWRSLLFLWASASAVMLTSALIYSVYAFLLVGFLGLYRLYTVGRGRDYKTFATVFVLGLGCAAMVGMLRVFPTVAELRETTRDLHVIDRNFLDFSFLGLRLFIPEIFGVYYRNSLELFKSLSPGLAGTQIHFAMPQFFGALPILLVAWAAIVERRGKTLFWLLYVLTSLALILLVKPFDLFARVLGHSLYHPVALQILLPVGFCMLAGYTAKALEAGRARLAPQSPAYLWLAGGTALVLAYSFLIWGLFYGSHARIFVGATLLVSAAVGFKYYFARKHPDAFSQLVIWSSLLTLSVGLGIAVFSNSPNKIFLSHVKLLSLSLALISFAYLYYSRDRLVPGLRRVVFVVGMPVGLLALYYLAVPLTAQMEAPTSRWQDLQLMALGSLKFYLTFLIFLAVVLSRKKWTVGNPSFYLLFFAVLVADLVPASKIHSFMVYNPFYNKAPFAAQPHLADADGNRVVPDLRNYRVNDAQEMLGLGMLRDMDRTSRTLATGLFGVRTFGGYVNAVPLRYVKLISTFEPGQGDLTRGMSLRISNERLKDLLGVAYDYDANSGELNVRKTAIARFKFFSRFKIAADDDDALATLQSKKFKPLDELVVEAGSVGVAKSGGAGVKILTDVQSSDRIVVKLKTSRAGVLFFGDDYNAGWKTFVDGKPATLLKTNFTFMGVAVAAGMHDVVFRYEPVAFYLGLKIALLGILFALGSAATLGWRERRTGAVKASSSTGDFFRRAA